MIPQVRASIVEHAPPFDTARRHSLTSANFRVVLLVLFVAFGLPSFTLASDRAVTVPAPYPGRSIMQHVQASRTSQYVTMRDGTKIAVDVYLPATADRTQRPAILHQTRYWRALEYRWPINVFKQPFPRGRLGEFAQRFLDNGYAWVDVDVRGSGASFGSRRHSHTPEEIQDGAEIVEWIIRQPWSNGKVGSVGVSYGGASAELLLANRHPAVKASAPMFSGFDLYPEIAFPGGVHLTWFTKTWSYINHELDSNALPFAGWLTKWLVRGVAPVDHDPNRNLLLEAVRGHQFNWDPYREGLGITFRDDPAPSEKAITIDTLSPFSYAKQVDQSQAAIYSYSGWFDGGYQHAAIRRHLTLRNPDNKLIIGPWDHGGRRSISPASKGPAQFDHLGELLKFFDYHVKGIETGVTREKPIHYFTMVEERWKAASTWPPPAQQVPWHLGPHQTLTAEPPSSSNAFERYHVDPSAGTGDQTRWNTLVGVPIMDPYPNRAEEDAKLLSFTSAPLTQDVEVTGHPVVTLFVRSTASDGAVFVYLEDVDESGKVTYVTEGMLRLVHRKIQNGPRLYRDVVPYRTFARADSLPVHPNDILELVIDLFPTSYMFKGDHRIRLAIAGADRDHFLILPNGPSEQCPRLDIFRDHAYPSRIDLPVIR